MAEKKRALIVDGSNYMFRAYYAVPQEPKKKFQTNCIRGFFNILMADIRTVEPTWLTVSLDRGTCWRHEEFPEYKGQRDRTNPDLDAYWPQRPIIRKLLRACGLHYYYQDGVEADDIMGTVAHKFGQAGHLALISTTDKDLTQCVKKGSILIMEKGTRSFLGPREVKDRMGVMPSKVIDYLTMCGDKVDNLPGIPRIAGKTASKLLNEHGSLDEIFRNWKSFTPALSKNIRKAQKTLDIDLMRRLVTVGLDEDIVFSPAKMNLSRIQVNEEKVTEICSQYRLQSLRELLLSTLQPLAKKSRD